jgi:hypothetical protein
LGVLENPKPAAADEVVIGDRISNTDVRVEFTGNAAQYTFPAADVLRDSVKVYFVTAIVGTNRGTG